MRTLHVLIENYDPVLPYGHTVNVVYPDSPKWPSLLVYILSPLVQRRCRRVK